MYKIYETPPSKNVLVDLRAKVSPSHAFSILLQQGVKVYHSVHPATGTRGRVLLMGVATPFFRGSVGGKC